MKSICIFLLSVSLLTPLLYGQDDYSKLPVKVVFFPIREAVLATQIDGTITKYHFRPGQRFQQGSILLQFDDKRYQNEYAKSESLIRENQLNVEFTKKRLMDNEQLFKNALQSEIEVERSRFEYSVALERLRSAKVSSAEALLQLQFCTVRAPFEGVVERLLTREFETVRGGQPLIGILDDNFLLAVMNLPSARIPSLKLGQKMRIRITENSEIVTGTVYEIASRADHRSETIEIKVKVDNQGHLLKPGMSGILIQSGR